MPADKTLAADVLHFVIAAVFIAMTMAFLVLPYALTFHPGEPPPHVPAATVWHLT